MSISQTQGGMLEAVDLTNTDASSVPQSVLVSYPNETCFDHSLYNSFDLSATLDMRLIRKSQVICGDVDEVISKFYAKRSISPILQKYLPPSATNEKAISQMALPYITPMIATINRARDVCKEVGMHLHSILTQCTSKPGCYSDSLFNSFCMVIFRLTCLDEVLNIKDSISSDLKCLASYLNEEDLKDIQKDLAEGSKWLDEPYRVWNQLFTVLKQASQIDFKKQISLIWTYLQMRLQQRSTTTPDLRFAMVSTVVFIVCFNASHVMVAQYDTDFLKAIVEGTPYIPLIHELSMNVLNVLSQHEGTKSYSFSPKSADAAHELRKLKIKFTKRSRKISNLISFDVQIEDNYKWVIASVRKALRLINYTKGLLRKQYVEKLANPPPGQLDMKGYERAIRHGYDGTNKRAVLQLLSLMRELHDLLKQNSPRIIQLLTASLHHAFQVFVKRDIARTFLNMKRNKQTLGKILENMRNISCDFLRFESPNLSEKQGVKPEEYKITSRTASPSPQLIELIRIQAQHITNSECEFMIPGQGVFSRSKAYRDEDEKNIKQFIADTVSWVDLIAYDQTLTLLTDQSDFYFKEVQLDQCKVVQFPVRASLPFTLCEYALENYQQPEITELIFYPLSIYDDAASSAIRRHKSQMMFEEIRAEASVCLETLSNIISEFCFNAFRTFASLRQLPEKLTDRLRNDHSKHWPVSYAYRLRTLLQQNHYYLLTKQITLNSLVAPRVDKQVNEAVQQITNLSKEFGIASAHAIAHGIEALKDTHKILQDQGLSLMPFPDIEKSARWDNFPLTFQSKFFQDSIFHLFTAIIPKYSLMINPNRLFPPKKIQINSDTLGKNALGKILKDALDTSVAFVSMSHFSVFVRQLSEGTYTLLANNMRANVERIFASLLEDMRIVSSRMSRIKDSSYGTPANTVFERYEYSYKYLTLDPAIYKMLRSLNSLGNQMMVAEMMDEAFIMKQFTHTQYISFLRSLNENNETRDEIDNIFDKQFQEAVHFIKNRQPTLSQKARGIMMNICLDRLTMLMNEYVSDFKEMTISESNGPILPPVTNMIGFPAIWSVLEFVYCQMESNRVVKTKGDSEPEGFHKYGNGVFIGSAILGLEIEQIPLMRILSIGRKIVTASEIDQYNSIPESVNKFVSIFKYGNSVYEWALQFFKQHVSHSKQSTN